MSGRTYSYEQCAKHIGLSFLGLNRNNVNRVEPLEARRLLAGELDPTFGGGDGIVTTDFTGFGEEAHALALYPDGRIVAAGWVSNGPENGDDWVISRYLPDGTLDASFSEDGRLVQHFGPLDRAYEVAVQPDGKVLVAGFVWNADRVNDDMAVARYNADGTLDATFGTGGLAMIDLSDHPGGSSDQAYAMALQPDGKIVLAGSSIRNNVFNGDPEGQNIAVARVNADGTLDTTFGGTGWVRTDHNPYIDRARGVVVYPDGRIAIAGETRRQELIRYDVILARYLPDGSPDTTFGPSGHGVVVTNVHPEAGPNSEDHAFDLVIQPDAKLVVAGSSAASGVPGNNGHEFLLMRYDLSGNLDPTFGGGDGIVTTNIDPARADVGTGLALAPDGKIAAVGFQFHNGSSPISPEMRTGSSRRPDYVLARYNNDGSVDASFGSGGFVETPTPPDDDFHDSAQDVLVQPDGNILVAGTVHLVPQQSWIADLVIERFVGGPGSDDVESPTVESAVFDRERARHKISFRFSEDVSASIDRADLHLVDTRNSIVVSYASMDVSYDHATDTATFTFPGALNGTLAESSWRAQLHRTGVRDAAGNFVAPAEPLAFTFLRGDATGDGLVNLSDFNILAANFGQAPRTFSQGDFNYDGAVNLSDFNLLAARFGQSLMPATAPGARGGAGGAPAGDEDPLGELLA